MPDLDRHVPAMTVVVVADGVDASDVHHIAEQDLRHALTAAGDPLTTRTHTGHLRSAQVLDVMSTAAALHTGALLLQPATRFRPAPVTDGP
ncbi:hypothetical protein GCM10012275_42680 [Longimycelium tulufanense]|uniref:Uncharacterized protein n=2 Tax=Longimycelium tulufanense TaxID=907463 RepID=A0A8J3FWM0_9PSEU|nr:hypothetical protein GCM10012275_42680 [Longimycelium tulufanense]